MRLRLVKTTTVAISRTLKGPSPWRDVAESLVINPGARLEHDRKSDSRGISPNLKFRLPFPKLRETVEL